MNSDELVVISILGISNLILGIGLGARLARKLSIYSGPAIQPKTALVFLLGMYFFECIAFPAGMATQVFTIGLAFVWGILLGRWLSGEFPVESARFALHVALYTCLPTISFAVIVPVAWVLAGNNPLTVEGGISFGIPEWIPWPLGSVAGFATALALGTMLFKTVITVGEVSTILLLAARPSPNEQATT
jgi:hypothetical protein